MAATRKQRVLRMLEKLDDDVTFDQIVYHLFVMKDIEIGLSEVARGEGIEHDEVFRELLGEDETQKAILVAAGKTKTERNKRVRRGAKRPAHRT